MTKRTATESLETTPSKKMASMEVDNSMTVRCIDNIRVLCADMVEKANSGHPGAPMGCAPIAHVLYGEMMRFSSGNSEWFNRDRFVLSNGHACALLYAMLHLTGCDMTMEDLKNFRQLGSRTPGHPENFVTPGVEVSTGPLGQGISNAVGIAMAERHLAAVFNRPNFDIIDNYTYVICGDGCLQEGISSEACSLAGHLGLGKLIVCYDDNLITIDGNTNLSFTEDVNARYLSYGWHVQTVDDANDITSLRAAINAAKAETSKPSIIKIRTVIGHGSTKQGTGGVHGAPLGTADIAHVKKTFNYDPAQSFVVLDDVRDFYHAQGAKGTAAEQEWNVLYSKYAVEHPELSREFTRRMNGGLPVDWKACLPTYSHTDTKGVATRNRSEEVLNALAAVMPEIIGGSADLTGSNLTNLKCSGDFQASTPAGRYIRFGVREHAMVAICNGMFAYGGFRPFCATFLNFIGYALGSVRVSALSRFGVMFIMTHDSIGLGEDGPTHQPVEMLECLRSLPNFLTIRPCDGNETVGAYVAAIEHNKTPVCISLSRQATPTLEGSTAAGVAVGAYVLSESGVRAGPPHLILVSTGTEVALAVAVAKELSSSDDLYVRVVSMPCCELFDMQTLDYQNSIFPEGPPVMSIEAGGISGWWKYAHAPFGMETFGVSAPAPSIFNLFGFTVPNLCVRAREVVAFYKEKGAPSLLKYPRFPRLGSLGH